MNDWVMSSLLCKRVDDVRVDKFIDACSGGDTSVRSGFSRTYRCHAHRERLDNRFDEMFRMCR